MDPKQLYVWEPLLQAPGGKATRILELLPTATKNDVVLECKIHNMELGEVPAYEALSYCWGTEIRDREITVILEDGTRAIIPITCNLCSALAALARQREDSFETAKQSRLLWIDALCIDQADVDEKAVQVQHMFKIFSRAQRTIVWLGDDDSILDNIRPLLNFVASLKYDENFRKRVCGDTRPYSEVDWPVSMVKYFGIGLRDHLAAYESLLRCPYWSRKWIVQELSASTEIQIQAGKQNVPWDGLGLLTRVVGNYHFRKLLLDVGADGVLGTQETVLVLMDVADQTRKGASLPLLEPLLMTADSEATDPRDQIYSLLSLASDSAELGIQPDYGGENDYIRTYVDSARAMIEAIPCWDVLYVDNGLRDVHHGNLPSWVPDWSGKWDYTRIWSSRDPGAHLDPENSPALTIHFSTSNRLHLMGQRIPMSRIGPKYTTWSGTELLRRPWEENVLEAADEYRAIEEFAKLSETGLTYFTGQPMVDVFLRTICPDHAVEDFEVLKRDFYTWGKQSDLTILMALAQKRGDMEGLRKASEDLRALTENGTRAVDFTEHLRIANKRLAWTACKALALVPERTEATDVLFIADGAPAPFALRHVKDNEYLLLGGVYIHGYMYGEALIGERSKAKTEVVIV